jgi:hypothetical protein
MPRPGTPLMCGVSRSRDWRRRGQDDGRSRVHLATPGTRETAWQAAQRAAAACSVVGKAGYSLPHRRHATRRLVPEPEEHMRARAGMRDPGAARPLVLIGDELSAAGVLRTSNHTVRKL